jgi:hypothetical protein
MNTTEVSTAEKKAVERDINKKIDIAAAEVILAAGSLVEGGMDFAADVAGQCGSLEPAICATLSCN